MLIDVSFLTNNSNIINKIISKIYFLKFKKPDFQNYSLKNIIFLHFLFSYFLQHLIYLIYLRLHLY